MYIILDLIVFFFYSCTRKLGSVDISSSRSLRLVACPRTLTKGSSLSTVIFLGLIIYLNNAMAETTSQYSVAAKPTENIITLPTVRHPERSEGSPNCGAGINCIQDDVPQVQQLHQNKVFTGKRISLNFQNIDIRAVLQILAEFTGKNIVVSDKVQGTITLRLNNIPWDQALDIILTTHGLDKRQKNNIIRIDTKISLRKMYAAHFKNQQASEHLRPVRSELLQVNYAKAADIVLLISDQQNPLLSEKGRASSDPRTNTIWIQDNGSRIDEVKKLITQLDVPVKQVLIEARIVQISKDFSRDLGIRWGLSKSLGNSVEQGGASSKALSYTQKLNLDLMAVPLSGVVPASAGIALAKLGDNILLDLELSALESEGRAELISSPRLITTNQQPAQIDSGQQIPYQESAPSGATSVAFKKAVLSLKVTPQITPDNKILMDLKINQDTASPQKINGVPAILTKEIQTNVLVGNGQTIVLGGIYQQDKGKTVTRIPFLGQLPGVGNLFKNTQISLRDDELIIFITPKIVINSQSKVLDNYEK